MRWQLQYINILTEKFTLLQNIKNNEYLVTNYNLIDVINELNNIDEIKQFTLKLYIVKKTIKSMSFHLVAKSINNFIVLDVINNDSTKIIDIRFSNITEEEYNCLVYKSTKSSVFGYDIWKYDIKSETLETYKNGIEWIEMNDDITSKLLEELNTIQCGELNNIPIHYISPIYSNVYKFYDYDEKEYLIHTDDKIYHLYFVIDDCTQEECYTKYEIKEYPDIDAFINTKPKCIFMKYYKNSESILYDNFKYIVELEYAYKLFTCDQQHN